MSKTDEGVTGQAEVGERPRPRKASAAEVARRVGEVLKLRLGGARFEQILQHSAENGWGLKERQLREYVARADDLLVERMEVGRKRLIARHVGLREELFTRALAVGDLRTALRVLDSLGKLQGLEVVEFDALNARLSR